VDKLPVDVTLVELLEVSVDVDSVELVLVERLVLELDNVVLRVELRRTSDLALVVAELILALIIDADENAEEDTIVDLDDLPLACVCALARDTDVNDETATTRNMIVIRLRARVLLHKPATLIPN